LPRGTSLCLSKETHRTAPANCFSSSLMPLLHAMLVSMIGLTTSTLKTTDLLVVGKQTVHKLQTDLRSNVILERDSSTKLELISLRTKMLLFSAVFTCET